jgi:dTDP-4-amino-4,6-dideoxygalactose transaminase
MAERIPIVDLGAEYAEVATELEEAVLRVLRSGGYVLGPETRAFEEELAAYVGVRHAIGVGSGTEALWLALKALGVGPGDEVLTSPFTYFATVEAIAHTGATPTFADIEPGGFHLDPVRLADAVTPRTKVVMPVHLFGRCANMEAIRAITDARGLAVVEDAAQAIGAERGGRGAGAWGAAGAFSFYPAKSLGAAGDGGAVTTDDPELAERLRLLRAHGFTGKGHTLMGTTSRLDSIQAAVLRVKLAHLDRWLGERSEHVEHYRRLLGDRADFALPRVGSDERAAWSQLVVRSPRADVVRRALESDSIDWRHYYPRPAYREEALGEHMLPVGTCPEAELACEESISIPIYPRLAESAVERVAAVVRRALDS